jgi:hypothetical protein
MHRVLSAAIGVLLATSVLDAAAQQPAKLVRTKTAAAKTAASRSATADASRPTSGLFPGTGSNVFTTIQGNALNATNGVLPDSAVRLRDVRFGRMVAMATTDKSGLFAFRNVEPGSYVVELVGNDGTILATSQILSVDAGQAISAVVKLPFRVPPFGGIFGHTAASAVAVSSAAAASGLLAVEVNGCVSPPCQ